MEGKTAMNTLEDRLHDLAVRASENYQTAYSKFKDPDDAELFLEDLNAEAVADTLQDIQLELKRYIGE